MFIPVGDNKKLRAANKPWYLTKEAFIFCSENIGRDMHQADDLTELKVFGGSE